MGSLTTRLYRPRSPQTRMASATDASVSTRIVGNRSRKPGRRVRSASPGSVAASLRRRALCKDRAFGATAGCARCRGTRRSKPRAPLRSWNRTAQVEPSKRAPPSRPECKQARRPQQWRNTQLVRVQSSIATVRSREKAPALRLLARLCSRIEVERGGVDAVTFDWRLRAIVKYVTLVCPADGAVHLRTRHKEYAAILFGLDVLLVCGRPEARPSRAGVVLRLGAKERRAAASAAV